MLVFGDRALRALDVSNHPCFPGNEGDELPYVACEAPLGAVESGRSGWWMEVAKKEVDQERCSLSH